MKCILYTLIALRLLNCAFATPPVLEHLNRLPSRVDLGAYDNRHEFDDLRTLKYEVIWCNLDKYRNGKLLPQLAKIANKGRTPIVTIEAYPIPAIGGKETLLPDITAGKYDEIIFAMATETDSLGSPVCVRFAPEMDMDTDKPYARKPPEIFIPAYQHFVLVFRDASPTSLLIWTSVGNQGGEKYYPGDDYVDYTGYSLYEQADASKLWCGHERSFADWMNEKYPAFAKLGKPIMITELGIWGSPQKQRSWMEDAFATVGNYPLVKALIYFNAQDSVSWRKWGAPGAPNWRINRSIFSN
jgi:cellulose synthase (UDP-forming)